MIYVWPVIHIRSLGETFANARLAHKSGCAGIFLIEHSAGAAPMLEHLQTARMAAPGMKVGVNLLLGDIVEEFAAAREMGADATWVDCSGIIHGEASAQAIAVSKFRNDASPIFAGVDFKGQAQDRFPAHSAAIADDLGFIPTTSGPATGKPPGLYKIIDMKQRMPPDRPFAIASGLSPSNVLDYRKHITHALVATGISKDFYTFDEARLSDFMNRVAG